MIGCADAVLVLQLLCGRRCVTHAGQEYGAPMNRTVSLLFLLAPRHSFIVYVSRVLLCCSCRDLLSLSHHYSFLRHRLLLLLSVLFSFTVLYYLLENSHLPLDIHIHNVHS